MNPRNKWLALSISATLSAAAIYWESSGKVITVPYFDIAKVLTVCDGITGAQVIKGKTYTKADCTAFRNEHLSKHGAFVLKCTNVPLSQNQYDAFTLFTYNVGGAAYCKSSLLKKLNTGDYRGACDGLMAWTYAGGKFVQGLQNRRKFERDLCLRNAT